jgi:hypothetical protein
MAYLKIEFVNKDVKHAEIWEGNANSLYTIFISIFNLIYNAQKLKKEK